MNCTAKPPNPTEAVRWLRQSAMAGNIRAQYQLALCLHQGHGVDRNVQEAVCYFPLPIPFAYETDLC